MTSTSQSSLQVTLELFNNVYLLELNSVVLIRCRLKAGNTLVFFSHRSLYLRLIFDFDLIRSIFKGLSFVSNFHDSSSS